MESKMMIDRGQPPPADSLPFARSYQIEALDKALKGNTIAFFETGSGKTLIAVMLLRSYAHLLRKPSRFIAVFLVPQVVLVSQQARVLKVHTDLKVGMYWGEMGVDYWNAETWHQEWNKYEVLVMTPAILLNCLRHSFLRLEMIKILIFDECHHARGKHPYACIMTEFYHRHLQSESNSLPRIFGMTASPVKSKGLGSSAAYWKSISDLENLMNSKVYTCSNESVLAEYISFSTPKIKAYEEMASVALFEAVIVNLGYTRRKHEHSLENLVLKRSSTDSAMDKLSKIHSALEFCLTELGLWLALKAAESLSYTETDIFCWGKLTTSVETVMKDFCRDSLQKLSSQLPSDWSIGVNEKADIDGGFLTTKVCCLVDSLLEYRNLKDLRCIIFVERVITAVVLSSLLTELIWKLNGWKTEYIAGNNSGIQCQSRKVQNNIVDEFRRGNVNIIVATSILEEGLDVQSCNLVIRFDLPSNVCSFIQSRGRARMQNSDFVLLMRSGDLSTFAQINNFLASGDIMREQSLHHASVPCAPLESKLLNEDSYHVESTGAMVNLTSSIEMIYFFCSRLPSDGYFKPSPWFNIREEMQTITLYLPKSSPIQNVHAEGSVTMLKQIVCLEACKKLHEIGALTDHLVPEVVQEEIEAQESGDMPYHDERPSYFPPELVNCCSNNSLATYFCYLVEMEQTFDSDITFQNVFLLLRNKLEFDARNIVFNLEDARGDVSVHIQHFRSIDLNFHQISLCRKFQTTIFRVLLDYKWNSMEELSSTKNDDAKAIDYFVLPSTPESPYIIDWECIKSVSYQSDGCHVKCSHRKSYDGLVHMKNGPVCSCKLENSLVYTPYNGLVYCIDGLLHDLNGNSILKLKSGEMLTYNSYFKSWHNIELHFQHQSLLKGRHIFQVQNRLQRCKQHRENKDRSRTFVELPPELCSILISPISVGTLYLFSYMPTIMHRIESLLIAENLKRIYLDESASGFAIPTIKVLEAITTRKCQESIHLESLEALGDSFIKYATSQHLFKTFKNHHEGLLTIKKNKIISNIALCKLGIDRKLPGFIRNEPFDPKNWIIPGELSSLDEENVSLSRKLYVSGKRKVKRKTVADVVEALIGAFLSSGGEKAAVSFMSWLGIKLDFSITPYQRHCSLHSKWSVNFNKLESLLKYEFRDRSLLVEAITHASYMLPEIPWCYQRLEFLGDSVLDYLVTLHLYRKYPGLSPRLLTDLRSASVNNDCYARCAVKAGLQQHILHLSSPLLQQIKMAVESFNQLSSKSTFGWESETSFPKVLGDIIESLAGAVFIDSGCNMDIVFKSIIPLLEPLITPETLKLHPVRELHELCQKEHYNMKKLIKSWERGVLSITLEVEANGIIHRHTCKGLNKETAKRSASRELLKSLKESMLGA